MEREPLVRLIVAEAAFGDRPFAVTFPEESKHLQLRTDSEIWHKVSIPPARN